MTEIMSIGLFTPLISFLLLLFTSNISHRKTVNVIGCGSIFISLCCFTWILMHHQLPQELTLFSWIPIQGIWADFALYLDQISMLMAMIITGIGFLIHLYSVGYMEHDPDFARFFACLNFFIFSMLLLVLSRHLLLLFVGWEGVGLASYLLIGFWYERTVAAAAAIKAFVVNRIGDLGFLLGIIFTLHVFGTGDIVAISAQAKQLLPSGSTLVTLITLLFFLGAIGKSAQIPLHTWLPDAMAGPTPVSALIHAATMVTAGVYLIVRLHELFILSPLTMQIIGITGAITSLYAAFSAIGQVDIKKVLAYSTISQLGLMFLACGAGSFYAALFHLTTHAFIKALLFLTAGNILHACHEETELKKMGGLSQKMPVSNWLFLLGTLALSGIPPFAAFFSKDYILEEEHFLGWHVLYLIGLASSIMTGIYLIRAYYLTFKGQTRFEPIFFQKIKEVGTVMLTPLFGLVTLSIVGGFLGYTYHGISPLETFLSHANIRDAIPNNGNLLTKETLVAVLGGVIGMCITWGWLARTKTLRSPYKLLENGFYVDTIYEKCITTPLSYFSKFLSLIVEVKVVENMIYYVTVPVYFLAQRLQQLQNGQIRSYIAWMIFGLGFTLLFFVLRNANV